MSVPREMALRWTWRWDLRHLLELCGFVVARFDGQPRQRAAMSQWEMRNNGSQLC